MKKFLGLAMAMASIANAQTEIDVDNARKYFSNSLGSGMGGKRNKYKRKAEPKDLHHKKYVRRKMTKQSRKNNRKK